MHCNPVFKNRNPTVFSVQPGGNRLKIAFLKAVFHLGGQKTRLDFGPGVLGFHTLAFIFHLMSLSTIHYTSRCGDQVAIM